jgi:hypothetical protein
MHDGDGTIGPMDYYSDVVFSPAHMVAQVWGVLARRRKLPAVTPGTLLGGGGTGGGGIHGNSRMAPGIADKTVLGVTPKLGQCGMALLVARAASSSGAG